MSTAKNSKAPATKYLSTPGSAAANGSVAASTAVKPSPSRPRDMSHSLMLHNIGKAGVSGSRSFSGKDIGGFYSLKD